MRYFRCKCGKLEAWGSMEPYACDGCPECGTTLASHPDNHRAPVPHDYSATVEQSSEAGPVSVPVCRYCGQARWEIEGVAPREEKPK